MKLFIIDYTGTNHKIGHLVYTRQPDGGQEKDVYEIDVDLPGYTVGGNEDDPCMVFSASGHGYAITFGHRTNRVLLRSSFGEIVLAVEPTEQIVIA